MRKAWLGAGITFMVLSVLVLGLGLWEALVGIGANVHHLELPGFHELELKEPGIYAGIYQHQGAGAIPAAALSKMSVKVFAKENFQEIPVVSNKSGGTFSRLGQQGMLLFNFMLHEPGRYTLSGLYLEADPGPTVPVILVNQGVRSTKPTLVVTVFFFLFFMTLGIWMVRKKQI